jgi:hypothetical protein
LTSPLCCNTTGHASTGTLKQIDSNTITRSVFANVFMPNEFPNLILIDEGSEFKGKLIAFCKMLGIHSHNGIICTRDFTSI